MAGHALTGGVSCEVNGKVLRFAFDFNAQCELEAAFRQTTDQILGRLLIMAATLATETPRYDKSLIRGVIWASGLEAMDGWTLKDAGKYCQTLGDQGAADLSGNLWHGSGLLDAWNAANDTADGGAPLGNQLPPDPPAA